MKQWLGSPLRWGAVAFGMIAAQGAAVSDVVAEPIVVSARYEISLSGIDVGSFKFRAETENGRYHLKADGGVKALFGAVEWSGEMDSEGHLLTPGIEPIAYQHVFVSKKDMLFKKKRKKNKIEMAFRDGAVESVAAKPRVKTKGRVPVEPRHLRNVFDPLSAILVLSEWREGNPCERSLEIFDGKTRFRLEFNYKSRTSVKGQNGGHDYVCGVRYVPVAGHKKGDEETEHVASKGEVSVVLRTFPETRMIVPREVSVSTIAGLAVLRVRSAEMSTDSRTKIALIR